MQSRIAIGISSRTTWRIQQQLISQLLKNGKVSAARAPGVLVGQSSLISVRSFSASGIAEDGTYPVVATKPPEENHDTNRITILQSAAKEAERLIDQTKNDNATKTTRIIQEDELAEVLFAAESLLKASRPVVALADSIAFTNSETVQIGSLHRAYITLTSRCLDLIDCIPEDDAFGRIRKNILMDRALELAQSAHEISLPFHLPLYQRLINTTVELNDPKRELSTTVLDIVSWIAASNLNIKVNENVFRSPLLTLIRNAHFEQAADLMMKMEQNYDIKKLGMSTVTKLLLQLRESIMSVLEQSPGTGRRDIPEEALIYVMSFLEKSIVSFSDEQEERLEVLAAALDDDDISNLIETLNPEDVEEIMSRMFDSDGESDEECSGSDDDSDFYFEEKSANPLDDIIHSIMTKKVADPTARNMMSDIMKSHSTSENEIPKTVRIIVGQYDENGNFSCQSMETDSSRSGSDERYESRDDCIVIRKHFPDITSQVEALNGGHGLHFTRLYKKVLWLKEHEDENNLGNFCNSVEEVNDLDDDDDDDDDDDF